MFLGLKSPAQDSTSIDSAKYYRVQGYQIRNSYMKMIKAKQFSVELDSCRSLTLSLFNRVKYSDSLLSVKNRRVMTLTELNNNYVEELNFNKKEIKKTKDENKKKQIRQGILIGAVAFVLGILTSVLI